MYSSPFTPSFEIGDIVTYAPQPYAPRVGCAYIERVIDIKYHEIGGYYYILKSDMPKSFTFQASRFEVYPKDCKHCAAFEECRPYERIPLIN